MNNRSGILPSTELKELFNELESETEEEIRASALAKMSPQEKNMAEVAQNLLRMERDMMLPGSAQSTADRIKRLGDYIESRDF
jgi:hypothetical protein